MGFEWEEGEYLRLSPFVLAARTLEEDWFRAMEDGTVDHRLPDAQYPVDISDEVCEQIVEFIDRGFEKELSWAGEAGAGGYTTGPGFSRLKGPQRLAFCQELHRLKVELLSREPQPEVGAESSTDNSAPSYGFPS